jgi:uncharacterized protein (TIGR02246 family)
LVSAILFGTLCLGSLKLVSGRAPQQTAPAPAPAAAPAQATSPAPARAPAQATAAAAPRAEEKPIRDLVDAFAKAYSKPDLKALDALFTDQANVIDSAGETTRGKPEVMRMFASSFEENPALKLEPKVEEVNFVTPDVARVEGQSRLSTATGEASEYMRFSGLAVNRDGKWLIAEIRESAALAEDVSSYDRLSELEWMVGDWVDESENVKSTSSVTWADNDSFLVRTYKIEVKGEKPTTGTMFVGWDPQTGQIKSWHFDSNGGHGEGLWTRTGENEWVVKAHGVLRDGRPTSDTQIHVVLNKHSVKTSSVDRFIGGQIAPDITDGVMVRKPPQARTAPTEPATLPAAQPATAPAAQPRTGASSK